MKQSRRPQSVTVARLLLWTAIATGVQAACSVPVPVLTRLVDARRLASDLRVEFGRAADASNRAVMADTDEGSVAAAEEAKAARQVVERDVEALRALLESLGYREDLDRLDTFRSRFEDYRRLDDEILPLAGENTNLKAQRMSFGPAREAADAFNTAVDAVVRSAPQRIRSAPGGSPRRRGLEHSRFSPCRLRTSPNLATM